MMSYNNDPYLTGQDCLNDLQASPSNLTPASQNQSSLVENFNSINFSDVNRQEIRYSTNFEQYHSNDLGNSLLDCDNSISLDSLQKIPNHQFLPYSTSNELNLEYRADTESYETEGAACFSYDTYEPRPGPSGAIAKSKPDRRRNAPEGMCMEQGLRMEQFQDSITNVHLQDEFDREPYESEGASCLSTTHESYPYDTYEPRPGPSGEMVKPKATRRRNPPEGMSMEQFKEMKRLKKINDCRERRKEQKGYMPQIQRMYLEEQRINEFLHNTKVQMEHENEMIKKAFWKKPKSQKLAAQPE